jgi:hypothetical protein
MQSRAMAVLSPPPATASAEGAQLNGRPFPATASAEGAQFNVPPSLRARILPQGDRALEVPGSGPFVKRQLCHGSVEGAVLGVHL